MDTIEMGLFYPYRETRKYGKMGEEPMPFVDTVGHGDRPVDRQLSTGRRTDRTVNWCVQRPDVFLPSRRITGSISITSLFPNSCDVLEGFADIGYLSDPY